jgi:hypothetical protein
MVLDKGDESAGHSGSKGGLVMGSTAVSQYDESNEWDERFSDIDFDSL